MGTAVVSAVRHPWWFPLASWTGAAVIRLIGATWRFERADAPEYTAAVRAGERFVYAFWHSGLLSLVLVHRNEGIAVLVSRHRDGELMARVNEWLGYVNARGSSTRGGETGVRELMTWAESGHSLAITPDGPRGPAEQVKAGLVYVASRTRLRVVPIAVASKPVWALRSWDRFRVPRPFARVRVVHGAPIPCETPAGTDPEVIRLEIERALRELNLANREQVGEVL